MTQIDHLDMARASAGDGPKSGLGAATDAQTLRRERYLAMDMLRLITCGSVDDGKSTLIGRLLYDTKSIHEDQWEQVHRTSLKRGDQRVDLALLTDGLRAEREQGITIDVAYRYFSTPRRKFILADTPGHVQYTRNMVTGASTAQLALILVDARQGVLEQTRRHAYLAALVGIRRLVVCVNKMDLVGFDEAVFRSIAADFARFAATTTAGERAPVFAGVDIALIPMSALDGDNVVDRSKRMPWHDGPALLELLEAAPAEGAPESAPARFFVQWIVRPQSDEHHDHRGYAGKVSAGAFRVGDEVLALPGGQRSRIAAIHLMRDLHECRAPQSVSILLEHDIDLARGDLLVKVAAGQDGQAEHPPFIGRDLDATLVWMGESPLTTGRRCFIKHGTRSVRAVIGPIEQRLNIHTLQPEPGPERLALNDIGRVGVRLAAPIAFDAYGACRETGAFIVIDEATNGTVGAGMICGPRTP